MNSRILISPSKGFGFQLLSGKVSEVKSIGKM